MKEKQQFPRKNQMNSAWQITVIGMLFAVIGLVACGDKKSSNKADKTSASKKDQKPEPADFPGKIKWKLEGNKWDAHPKAIKGKIPKNSGDIASYMTLENDRENLLKSFDMGTKFLMKYQFEEGNFRYQYDWIKKTWKEGDNQVRQGGALWGLSLCHRYKQTEETKKRLMLGFDFWFKNTVPGPDGSLAVKYKEEANTQSGTVALLGLAMIEFMRVEKNLPEEYQKKMKTHLDGYLKFLASMQLKNGQFAKRYNLDRKKRSTTTSPYFDGEVMLCLVKAARHLGYEQYVPAIEKAARATAEIYTFDAWKKEKDSNQTKGFYQWSSMAFTEYYQAKWKDYQLYGDIVLVLAHWMIHTHNVFNRSLNTSYALEGLISAYRIAKDRKDVKAQEDLLFNIDRILHKLTTWQINGPYAKENKFIQANPTTDEWAVGGIMNKKKPAKRPQPNTTYHELRVDVTQHQMHAVTLALRYVYP